MLLPLCGVCFSGDRTASPNFGPREIDQTHEQKPSGPCDLPLTLWIHIPSQKVIGPSWRLHRLPAHLLRFGMWIHRVTQTHTHLCPFVTSAPTEHLPGHAARWRTSASESAPKPCNRPSSRFGVRFLRGLRFGWWTKGCDWNRWETLLAYASRD